MRSILLVFAWLFAGTVLRGEEPVPDIKQLQGTWEVVEFTANGKVIPEKGRQGMKFEVTDTTMHMSARGREASFQIKLNTSVTPNTIDYTALEGTFKDKTNYGIYELKGDELKLCMHNKDADKPPTAFKSVEGDNVALFVLRRVKTQP